MENHHFFNGKIHYKWQFSIAIFVYQRVHPPKLPQKAKNSEGLNSGWFMTFGKAAPQIHSLVKFIMTSLWKIA
jgi:hypothetical protein